MPEWIFFHKSYLSHLIIINSSLSLNPLHSNIGIQSGRIIYNIEDCPQRFYPEWYSCTIQERRSSVEEVTPETSKDIAFDLSNALQDVGRGLQSEAQGEVELDK